MNENVPEGVLQKDKERIEEMSSEVFLSEVITNKVISREVIAS